jgi:lipopolysaccharide export LptBFGC system permease protein LptF
MTDKPEQPPSDRPKGVTDAYIDQHVRQEKDYLGQPSRAKNDLTDAYARSAFLIVPRVFFPFFAIFFVLLCGAMAVMLFAVGKIFGGLLFSFVVLVGLYVLYNKLTHKDPM